MSDLTDWPEGIEQLRAILPHSGPYGTTVVTMPKLARDWLCDLAESAAVVPVGAEELAAALRFALPFVDWFPVHSWCDDEDDAAPFNAALKDARDALARWDAVHSKEEANVSASDLTDTELSNLTLNDRGLGFCEGLADGARYATEADRLLIIRLMPRLVAALRAERARQREPDRESRRTLSMGDLFPPEGTLYLTDERIEELRQLALPGERVSLSALTVMEVVCDLRNTAAELVRERTQNRELRAALEAARNELNHWGWGDLHYGSTPQAASVVAAVEMIAAALSTQEEEAE